MTYEVHTAAEAFDPAESPEHYQVAAEVDSAVGQAASALCEWADGAVNNAGLAYLLRKMAAKLAAAADVCGGLPEDC